MDIIKTNSKTAVGIFLFSFLFCLLLIPFIAQADSSWWPLVQCGGGPPQPDCTLCDLLELAQRVLHFAIQMAFLIIVIFIVYGGFRWIFSVGKEENIREGQRIITNAIVGLIIILCAWLIVNTVFWFIVQVGFSSDYYTGTWYNIECDELDSPTLDSSILDSPTLDNLILDNPVESKCYECGAGAMWCTKAKCESLEGCTYSSYVPFGPLWGYCKPTEL